ncbi:shikimate dehydrogenase [Fontibacillus solani]|uniref:Shikimate dehydrogenase (NADP(+)) n=1 Tax=Fontibacillus solani TaxID=1572857 RepID=A0A7W3SRY9_9BACL|nr:shikimate dehydrogenase [Fontibacillus solani]MBA9085120.1 shikimate dehydrogenase [Fontibacillus solani]
MDVIKKELKDTHLLLGVMGDPILHSKSPAMHMAALKATGVPGTYVPLHVTRNNLKDAIQGVRALGFRGVNVTVPHKVEVMKYVDVIDEGARYIGAVNTIVNDEGVLTGYNTDGIGYIRSLKEEAISDLRGKNVLVLGSGGAARGVIYALLKEGPAQVIVANRTASKSNELAQEWSQLGNIKGCSMDEVPDYVAGVDLLINTTSVGMYPDFQASPIKADLIPDGIVVSDLIYNPLKTELLRQAEMKGCVIHNGLGMFVYQGGYAFEYWTGLTAPIDAMREAVSESLN